MAPLPEGFMKVEELMRVDVFETYHRLERGTRTDRWIARSVHAPEIPALVDVALSYEDVQDEAELGAQLDHPNIPPIAAGLADPTNDRTGPRMAYLARSFPLGPRLSKLAAQAHEAGALVPAPIALEIAAQAARALHHCHETGHVHGAFTPGSVWLDRDGQVRVTGFAGDPRERPVPLSDMAYWTPEHALGQPLRAQSDIYALGVILFELLTRRRWLKTPSLSDVVTRLRSEEVPAPSGFRADLSQAVDELVLSMVRRDPRARCENAGVLAEALQAAAQAERERDGAPELAVFVSQICAEDFSYFDGLVRHMATIPVGRSNDNEVSTEWPWPSE